MVSKLLLAATAIMLAGCTVNNPIGNNTEATAESAYAASATAAAAYLSLPFCAAGKHFSVLVPCKETSIIQKVKADNNVAYTALLQLRAYHKANPTSTVSEIGLINAVVNAAAAVKSAIPS